MKTLKFMLAAATAIGLASATQAGQLPSSTGFEKWAAGETVVVGTGYSDQGESGQSTYFWKYAADDEDNESTIVALPSEDLADVNLRPKGTAAFDGADASSRSKVLQVSTGTNPLLRRIKASGNADNPFTIGGSGNPANLYVDTLVQFTVTPPTDVVTPTPGVDKLMIYLQQSVDPENSENMLTNLVVVGGFYLQDYNLVPTNYIVTNMDGVDFGKDQWHRLTVKAIPNFGNLEEESFPAFQISIDGTPCRFDRFAAETDLNEEYPAPFTEADGFDFNAYPELDDKTIVFSMVKGSEAAQTFSLTAVGFAGEGKVDDLVISTFEPSADIIMFTLGMVNDGFDSTLHYTCSISGISGDLALVDGTTQFQCYSNDLITVSYTARTGWDYDWTLTGGATISGNVITPFNGGTATITASQSSSGWDPSPATIPDNTPAGTKYPALDGTALASADAKKLTIWADAYSVSFEDASTNASAYVDAYLLNCAVANVETEKDEFVLTITFDEDGNPEINLPAGKAYNGTLQLKGATDIKTQDWAGVTPGVDDLKDYSFFKYDLSL